MRDERLYWSSVYCPSPVWCLMRKALATSLSFIEKQTKVVWGPGRMKEWQEASVGKRHLVILMPRVAVGDPSEPSCTPVFKWHF